MTNKNLLSQSKQRIDYLDSLRALAIIMVVGVHALNYCIPLTNEVKNIISLIVHSISVPIFFLVDGFLFAHSSAPNKKYNYLNATKLSANRLLIPWLIFSTLYFIARFLFEFSGAIDTSLLNKSPIDLALAFYSSIYAPQLYFLASLFIIRLFNPLFRRIIFKNNLSLTLLLFLFLLTAYQLSAPYISGFLQIEGGEEPLLHAIWGVQYYAVGIFLYKVIERFDIKNWGLLTLPLLLVCVMWLDTTSTLNLIAFQYLYLFSIFMLFFFADTRLRFLNSIGSNTMGIYLIHAPIIIKATSLGLNKIIFNPLLNYCLLLVITLVLSLVLTLTIKKIPYGYILFGERPSKK